MAQRRVYAGFGVAASVLLALAAADLGCSSSSGPSGESDGGSPAEGGTTAEGGTRAPDASDSATALEDAAADASLASDTGAAEASPTDALAGDDSGDATAPEDSGDATVAFDQDAGSPLDATLSAEAGDAAGGASLAEASTCAAVAIDDAASPGVVVTAPPALGGVLQLDFGPTVCAAAPSQPLTIANPSPVAVTWSASVVNATVDLSGSTLAPGECVVTNVTMPLVLGETIGSVTVDDGYHATVVPTVEDISGVTATGPATIDLGTVMLPSSAYQPPDSGLTPMGDVNVSSTGVNLMGTACPAATCEYELGFLDGGAPVCGPEESVPNQLGANCMAACDYPYYLGLGSVGDFTGGRGSTTTLDLEDCLAPVGFSARAVAPGTYTAALPIVTVEPGGTVCGAPTVTATITIVAPSGPPPPPPPPPALTPVEVVPSGVVAIAAGGDHTCALTAAGAVSCWGDNTSGESQSVAAGVTAIAAGDDYTCAITSGGGVECWGNDSSGALGNDSTTTGAGILSSVWNLTSGTTAIAAGEGETTCAIQAGAVLCWGDNPNGELGTNTGQPNDDVPGQVVGLSSGATAVTVGSSHACALMSADAAANAGSVLCWGDNTFGDLGNGSTIGSSPVPVAVTGLPADVTAIAAGWGFTCALTGSGAVYCWGNNEDGQLGDNSRTQSNVPVPVSGLSSGVTAIAAGWAQACALTTAGTVLCWGDGTDGDLGNDASMESNVPVAVSGLPSGVIAIAAGQSHTCALTRAGAVYCWGDAVNATAANYGPVVTEDGGAPFPPGDAAITAPLNAESLGVGGTCAVLAGGAVACWPQALAATPVSGITGATALSQGPEGSAKCALLQDGTAECWGAHVGNGSASDSLAPVPVSNLTGVTGIAPGDIAVCAVVSNGSVACWGDEQFEYDNDGNFVGEYDGGTTDSDGDPVALTPVTLAGVTGATAIAVGQRHWCALVAGGAVTCWGTDSSGELGDGTIQGTSPPVTVPNLTGVTALAAGVEFTCALMANGTVECWGDNSYGQLGVAPVTGPSCTCVFAPTPVPGLTGVTAISAGDEHVCALLTGGTIECWGSDSQGQLGDGQSFTSSATPVVAGFPTAIAVSAGNQRTCALLAGGGVACVGQYYFSNYALTARVEEYTP
jgi:alpha-tubulin suppressor-like RCC1 family protein